jgi:hypothetical protein
MFLDTDGLVDKQFVKDMQMWHERNSSDESAEDEDDDFKSDYNKPATNNHHNTFLERNK